MAGNVDDSNSRIAPTTPFDSFNNFINAIKGVTGNQGSTSSTSTTSIGDQGNALLQQFLDYFMPQLSSQDYSKEAATKDAQGLIDQIMTAYKETDLPKIYQAQNASGGYNSPTAQLLANDAFARATAQGAAAVTNTVNTYGKLQAEQTNTLLNLVTGIARLNTTTSQQGNSTTGALGADAAKKAALAAIGAKAASLAAGQKKSNSAPAVSKDPNNQDQNPDNPVGSPLATRDLISEGADNAVAKGDDQIKQMQEDITNQLLDTASNSLQNADLLPGDQGTLSPDTGIPDSGADENFDPNSLDFSSIFNQDLPDFTFPEDPLDISSGGGIDTGSDTEEDF